MMNNIFEFYVLFVLFSGIAPCSTSEVMKIVNRLTSQRLILTEHSRNYISLRLRLNISTDDINYALQNASEG